MFLRVLTAEDQMQAWLLTEISKYEGYIADLRSLQAFGGLRDTDAMIARYSALVERYKAMLADASEP